jgi:hypothetical protein
MAENLLGKLLAADAERDAVHVPIYPAVAGERLQPGQRVGINRATGRALAMLPPIGVVDPFLDKPVEPGERFYICVRPGNVVGLRHHYKHPAFDDMEETKE